MQKHEADIGACEEAADMGVRRRIGINVLQVPTNTTLVLFGKKSEVPDMFEFNHCTSSTISSDA